MSHLRSGYWTQLTFIPLVNVKSTSVHNATNDEDAKPPSNKKGSELYYSKT